MARTLTDRKAEQSLWKSVSGFSKFKNRITFPSSYSTSGNLPKGIQGLEQTLVCPYSEQSDGGGNPSIHRWMDR